MTSFTVAQQLKCFSPSPSQTPPRVTILKDEQRRSRGVAFVQYLRIGDAQTCCTAVEGTEMFGRRLRASIATDNGRSAEFIRKRTYENKQRCYECGESGHLSYKCPVNVLGEREPPVKRTARTTDGGRRRGRDGGRDDDNNNNNDDEDGGNAERDDSRAVVVAKKMKFKPNSYLSDEEDVISD